MEETQREVEERLIEEVKTGNQIAELAASPAGQFILKKLEDEYKMLVLAACKESKYAPALTTIENIFSEFGLRITSGMIASKNLESLRNPSDLQEY